MRKLEAEFDRAGWHFKQLYREGGWAIYLKTKFAAEKNRPLIHSWEVIRVQINPERAAFGKVLPEGERYPSSEEWGEYGWSCMSEERAYQCLRKMQERFGNPPPKSQKGGANG